MGNLVFQATLGGQVNLVGPNTASTYNINVPTVNGDLVTTGDTGTVTNTMLASSAYTAPGTIGSGTPNTGAFTTLTASTSVLSPIVGAGSGSSLSIQSNGTTKATLDSSGNLGLGVTPSAWGSGYKALQIGASGNTVFTGNSLFQVNNAYNNGTNWIYQESSGSAVYEINRNTRSHIWYNAASGTAGNPITFTQAMTLDASGNLLVGTTTASVYNQNTVNGITFIPGTSSAIQVSTDPAGATGNACAFLNMRNTPVNGAKYLRTFYNGTTETGSISLNGTTGVLFNTSSDYRLKEITGPVTGAKEFIMALQPKQGSWKSDGSKFVGFLAHEFQEVSPSSVVGEKDAVDADGNPIYQAMQASSPEVMANLVAFVQEQQAIIEQLKADVAALKVA